ncbi:MAG: DUF5682 family protein [Saprospiraceae bacterium]
MPIHILGIRHHGVGSAQRVLQQLKVLKPDLILIEGPPEINEILPYIGQRDLSPPVAIMLYDEAEPGRSIFYPFAQYSPEWVAAGYANQHQIPVQALDLPAKIKLQQVADGEAEMTLSRAAKSLHQAVFAAEHNPLVSNDPLSYLASAAGYEDSEQWWDYLFERGDLESTAEDHFKAVMEAMQSLRDEHITSVYDVENEWREAYMRMLLRKALQEMYDQIVVICGAWHVPALRDLVQTEKTDALLLKKLPNTKIKVQASWIPWSNGRLSMYSGYGAGITSPGWYEHLWTHRQDIELNWLTKVADQFRAEGMDMSTAHVIEAYKLALGLCQLRGHSHVGLHALNEAVLTVMCMGDGILLDLIRESLIIGDRLGTIPADIPKVPLQQDFEQSILSLRLKLSVAPKVYQLDLRKPLDIKRSTFFHRLLILQIQWAVRTQSRTKGTFKESWQLQWQPSMMIELIDKAFLGNTIAQAASEHICRLSQQTNKIAELTTFIDQIIPAELFDSIDFLLDRINTLSTISSDIRDLMRALPALINISRYGNVRQTDLGALQHIVTHLLTKVSIGLPNACYGLDESNANQIFELIAQLNGGVKIYDQAESTTTWYTCLFQLMQKEEGIHDIIQGCVCRLLLDAEQIDTAEASERISYALSAARNPYQVASWMEGFLRGSGMILLYDPRLWNLLYRWTEQLDREVFLDVLPYLRRAFSRFDPRERKRIGQRAKEGLQVAHSRTSDEAHHYPFEALALPVLDTLQQLMGGGPTQSDYQ